MMIRLFFCLFIFAISTSVQAATWYELKSKNFIIYTDGSKSKASKMLNQLEAFDFYLKKILGVHADKISAPLKI